MMHDNGANDTQVEFIDWHSTPEQLEEQRRRYFQAWENVYGTKHPEDNRDAR